MAKADKMLPKYVSILSPIIKVYSDVLKSFLKSLALPMFTSATGSGLANPGLNLDGPGYPHTHSDFGN